MRTIPWFSCLSLPCLLLLPFATVATAVAPSEALLPDSTKGYVAVARADEFADRWAKTQLGEMLADDVMQPFIEDFREQFRNQFRTIENKLGITWDDLEGVSAGEMSLAVLERPGRDAALAITIDVSERQAEADKLLAAIEQRFTARGGKKQTVAQGGVTLLVFDVPANGRQREPQQTVYFIKDDVLCGVDDRAEAQAMLGRFAGDTGDSLRSVAAYRETMERCRVESQGLEPELRWYVEPFAFIFATRTLRTSPPPTGRDDYARIFSEQGFDAIRGAGGHVNLLVPGHIEILNRAAVYAPPAPGQENDPLRWNLSMRMLQMPNASGFVPQSWVPRMSASYATLNLKLDDAFDNVGPLFDALQGHANAWANTLRGWEVDPYGAQINVRDELVAHLGQRVTILTDYSTPITTGSERSVMAIEATDERQLAAALEKWMSREPDVERREIGGVVVWERVPPQAEIEQIDIPGFGTLQPDTPADDDREQPEHVLPNSAACVALGQFITASDINYLRMLLEGFGQRELLSGSDDYQQVVATMTQLAPGAHSVWAFGRTDEELRPTFELVRQGKMPEGETMLAKLLNDLLTTDVERQEGVLRSQRIDGSRLPNFEAVRRYLGPAGRVIRSDRDGWFFTGAVLHKEAP